MKYEEGGDLGGGRRDREVGWVVQRSLQRSLHVRPAKVLVALQCMANSQQSIVP